MIDLPQNFIQDLIGVMGSTIADLLPLLLFLGGVFLACFILRNAFWAMIDRSNGINKEK